jgi:DNA-binding transcriptional LysR family regulator
MRHMRILQYVDEVARTGSIRRAASRLHVTASAVNRRIMDLEEELGAPLFERKARGVRLTAAGEVFVRYVREQGAGLERTRSHIEDLRGLRRGTVRIACSQALAFDFMPRMIAEFRRRHAHVEFDVRVLDHINATTELVNYGVDLALVFRPPPDAKVQSLISIEQRLVVMMAERHPLSARRTVRLRDCASYPIVLPDRSFGGRQLLEEVWARSSLELRITGESNSFEFLRGMVRHTGALSFQIEIGTEGGNSQGIVARPIDGRDIPRAKLVLAQLRGRSLPLASAVFAEELTRALERRA